MTILRILWRWLGTRVRPGGRCPWYWGTHGCDRPAFHRGLHECGTGQPTLGQYSPDEEVHSRFDSKRQLVWPAEYDEDDVFLGWGEPWKLKGFRL